MKVSVIGVLQKDVDLERAQDMSGGMHTASPQQSWSPKPGWLLLVSAGWLSLVPAEDRYWGREHASPCDNGPAFHFCFEVRRVLDVTPCRSTPVLSANHPQRSVWYPGTGRTGDMTLTTLQKGQAPSLALPSCPGRFLLLCPSLILSSKESSGAEGCSFLP